MTTNRDSLATYGGQSEPALVSLEDVRAAAARIGGVVRRTPVLPVPFEDGGSAWLKCENMQVTGSFKARGAYNFVVQVAEASRRGVITYSSGNCAQAVAYAAGRLGLPSVVVMPTTAPEIKVRAARRLGAEVILEGTLSSHRKARAEREAAGRGLAIVPPCDHPFIIAGQGTVGLELVEDCPELRTVFVQIGGGGLISGVAAALKLSRPQVRVIGVEPVGAARMTASRKAGRSVSLEGAASIADGLLPLDAGAHTWAHVSAFVDEIVTVDDAAIAAAVLWLFRTAKLVAEPSGAAALAGMRQCHAQGRERAACATIVSGGNVALTTLVELRTRFGGSEEDSA